jgi:hypothetical protein
MKPYFRFLLIPIFICASLIVISSCGDLFGSIEQTVDAPNPPTITGSTPTGDATPTWTWTFGQNIVDIRYQLDSESDNGWTYVSGTHITSHTPANDLREGSHILYVQIKGQSGKWSISGSFTIVIDLTTTNAPVVDGPAATNNTTPTWTWTLPEGAVGYRYQVDGEFSNEWTEINNTETASYTPESNLTEGEYILYVQAKNDVGNWSDSGFFSILVDSTSPSIIGLTDDDTPRRQKVWNWSSNESDVEYRYIIKPSQEEPSDWTGGTWSSDTSASITDVDGIQYIHVQVKDEAGNTSATYTVYATLDSTATDLPYVSGTTPTKDTTPMWTWETPEGAASFRYQLDSEAGTWTEVPLSTTSYTHETALSEGAHTLYVQASDATENWSASALFTITIDTTPPSAPIITSTTPTNNTTPTWDWNEVVSATKYRYGLTEGAWITEVATEIEYTSTVTLTENNHTLYVQASDDVPCQHL